VFSFICALELRHLRFDYDFEAFFPNEDSELEMYNQYRKTFGYDNEFILIALENKGGIFNRKFLERVDSLTADLLETPYVVKVNSPTRMKLLNMQSVMPVQQRLMHIEDPELYASDSVIIYSNPELLGSFFPEDARSLSIFIQTEDVLSKQKSDSLATLVKQNLLKYTFDDIHYVGRIFAQQVYLENLQKEFLVFILLAFALVISFLWFSFRTLYGIIVPVTVVLISILWTMAIMKWMGKPIDIMTVMLPTMIFIAGLSDVIHFFSKYMEERAKGTALSDILKLVVKEVGLPTFLTLVTTVVGFLSLLFSSIKPIRDFGIYTSVGVGIAFVLTYTLLPSLLILFPPKKKLALVSKEHRGHVYLTKLFFMIFRNQKMIVGIFSFVGLLSVYGLMQIRQNNILLEDLTDKVKIKQDFIFFDKHYSGVRPFELKVTVKEKNKFIWDYDVIKEINKVEEFVRKEYQAGFVLSPAQVVKSIYRHQENENYVLPAESDYSPIQQLLIDNRKNRDLQKVVSKDGMQGKVSAKIRDIGSLKIREHNQHLVEFIRSKTDTTLLSFQITGAAHLVDRNNEYMVSSMLRGFIFSIIIITLLTFALHRNWRMLVVFIIPNLFPLLVVSGVMGYMGIELKSATALVFSIALGIATDDTIHFISRLKIELGYGKSLLYAFKRTFFETGKPIILTSFILFGGFVSLMSSNFESTFYFGFLICITVVMALLADLFLLPVLLFILYRNKK
jgi:uncharacterized protein